MNFFIVLVISLVLVLICKPLIKKHAFLFYGFALFLDILFIAHQWVPIPGILGNFVFICIQKCTLALALLVIVMYIGIFPKGTKPNTHLMPIRKELSIAACFLSLGHMAMYLSSYAPRILANFAGFPINVVASLALSLILLTLLVILGVTSFDAVKKRMSSKKWKNIQRFAYLFFGLVYFHLLLFLLPSALQGGKTAQVSVLAYSCVFGLYLVGRLIAAGYTWAQEKKGLEVTGR